MSFFNRRNNIVKETFNKDIVKKQCIEDISKLNPRPKIIICNDEPYDLIVIRSSNYNVVSKLGSMGLHEQVINEILQEVFAVTIIEEGELIDDKKEYDDSWIKTHFIISNSKALIRKLISD